MPNISLDTGDAAELAELLRFLNDWLGTDHGQLDSVLARFAGNRAYDVSKLRNDVDRFTFLLGGSDGELLFQPGPR